MVKLVEETISVADFFEVAEEVACVNGVVLAVPVLMEADGEMVPVHLDLFPDQIREIREQLRKATSSRKVGLSFDITPGSVKEMRKQLPETDSNDLRIHDPDTQT